MRKADPPGAKRRKHASSDAAAAAANASALHHPSYSRRLLQRLASVVTVVTIGVWIVVETVDTRWLQKNHATTVTAKIPPRLRASPQLVASLDETMMDDGNWIDVTNLGEETAMDWLKP